MYNHPTFVRTYNNDSIIEHNLYSPLGCIQGINVYLCQRVTISKMRHVAIGQVVPEWFQLLWRVDPTPLSSPLPKPVGQRPSEGSHEL